MTRTNRESVPDFSVELARCDELDGAQADSPYWRQLCDEWNGDVCAKLWLYKPRLYKRFLKTSLLETSGGIFSIDAPQAEDEKLLELRARRRRLELIVSSQKKGVLGYFGWLKP